MFVINIMGGVEEARAVVSWGDEAFSFPRAELEGRASSSAPPPNQHAFWKERRDFVLARLPSLYTVKGGQ